MGFGLFRLGRFLKTGLEEGQFFRGLPVTYTGYWWIFCAWFVEHSFIWIANIGLVLLSFLMVWTGIKIKRTQTRYDAS
jgi:phosphatidylserine synthase